MCVEPHYEEGSECFQILLFDNLYTVDVDSPLGSLCCVNVCCVADVSEVCAASIFVVDIEYWQRCPHTHSAKTQEQKRQQGTTVKT